MIFIISEVDMMIYNIAMDILETAKRAFVQPFKFAFVPIDVLPQGVPLEAVEDQYSP